MRPARSDQRVLHDNFGSPLAIGLEKALTSVRVITDEENPMVRSRILVIALGIVFLSAFVATSSSAQTSLATLRGKVTDQQGGVLPGATVTTRQIETNSTRSGVTNESGQFY